MRNSNSVLEFFPKLIVVAVLSLWAGAGPDGVGWHSVFSEALAADDARPPVTGKKPADPLLRQIGVTKGLCVVLDEANCELALKLARETELLIYVQLPRAEDVESARRTVESAGLYGTRIYVEKGPLAKLYLADNLADALVAVGEAAQLPEAEALRVLRPQAKALLGPKELIKPYPAGVDDWSHPYHGPDNNPVSKDQLAQGPYLTQFLADPRYAPLPQVAVASGGRVFKAFGHIAFKVREEPWLNTLAAFSGYNGALLWRREIPESLMVHRNTFIATPTTLYFGDDKSCKVIDAATGELRDEIAPPESIAGGTFWKWMALENGVLYAMVGEQEQRDPVIRLRSDRHGWPWNPLSPGFNQPEHTWGFGRTVLAIDPKTKQVLWRHQETEPIDSRAVCMKEGRLFVFRFGSYLACLDAKTGAQLWRKTKENASNLFEALGSYLNRQDWRTNWRTTAYAKCSDKALYFSGPQIGKLLAVSAEDGRILWQHPYSNYQLILQEDGLYGLSGQIDTDPSRKFDPLTGKILEEIKLGRRACTRPTGAIDAIFCRANGGSTRLDLASDRAQLVSPMRAQCQDGVTIGNGLLYWWPSTCDCNLTLYGITCLGPAGHFDFEQKAVESERLERSAKHDASIAGVPESPADWPTFRANNTGTVTTEAVLPASSRQLWRSSLPKEITPTAPTTVGGQVFLSGSDGIVRALDMATGTPLWTAFTGGAVRLPPTLWKGRALVGSGDGWVYAFAAKTGQQLWRFRAAPVERRIPVYGQLLSTWPAASGVLVEDGVAYVAAGIVNYDGTHVYALDAATGQIKWQNNVSGHLDDTALSGVSVQGHILLHQGKLFLAGGNAVSPAIYDAASGKCLNDPGQVLKMVNNNVPVSESPRGWELYQIANNVMVSGKPYYSHPKYPVYDATVFNKTLLASVGDRDVTWVNNAKVMCFPRVEENRGQRFLRAWGKPEIPGLKPVWERHCQDSVALALCRNAVLIATASELVALDLKDGKKLWAQPLPASPVLFGLAVDREGRVIVTLENGEVLCFG
ncbi:MAG: PQQ-binding-like beta-propeller repeat protein [Verrucomicrobiota bacterium]